MKVNLITPPDILHNNNYQILVICPSSLVQKELQENLLPLVKKELNLYYYDKPTYIKEEVTWLLNLSAQVDITIIDLDNSSPHIRDIASYLIAKPNTFWLTNSQESVYNHFSKNKVFNLDFIKQIGEDNFETQQE